MFKSLITFTIFFLCITFSYADSDERKEYNREETKQTSVLSFKYEDDDYEDDDYEDDDYEDDDYYKNKRNLIIEETKNNFQKRKKELINKYKEGKVSLNDTKSTLLKEKASYIEIWKSKLEEEKVKNQTEKLVNLKNQVRLKLDVKLQKFNTLDKNIKNELFERVISKINEWLDNNKLSSKEKFLYSLLKNIFQDIINE